MFEDKDDEFYGGLRSLGAAPRASKDELLFRLGFQSALRACQIAGLSFDPADDAALQEQ